MNTFREGATIKFTQRLHDDLETESVIIPGVGSSGRTRTTLCLSSQVGCALGCTFCETAQMGRIRNLTVAEIVGQWLAARELAPPADHVVFMGMGEPMDNLDAVMQSIRMLTDHRGPAIAPSRICVSTVGLPVGIRRFADFADERGFGSLRLAVSINAPNDALRARLMPIARAVPLHTLREAMLNWQRRRPKRRVLIEYVLIPDVNDGDVCAHELAAYLRPLPCTVNVIAYNPRRDSPWPAPREAAVDAFVRRLHERGLAVRRRRTTGRTVMAGCGQLGNPHVRRRRLVPLTHA